MTRIYQAPHPRRRQDSMHCFSAGRLRPRKYCGLRGICSLGFSALTGGRGPGPGHVLQCSESTYVYMYIYIHVSHTYHNAELAAAAIELSLIGFAPLVRGDFQRFASQRPLFFFSSSPFLPVIVVTTAVSCCCRRCLYGCGIIHCYQKALLFYLFEKYNYYYYYYYYYCYYYYYYCYYCYYY